ncbi:hypothetical protein B0H15DRAFT_873156 [Mycena belliarum]|uniref:Uncharacterized protein n=1 Tax=Mycena belliarum TaxID=1033014 RepID=A0AAD6TKH8_9AGAR|nr:hypothetical protein B0H15DRAFT_873156 [Mycena belliae]
MATTVDAWEPDARDGDRDRARDRGHRTPPPPSASIPRTTRAHHHPHPALAYQQPAGLNASASASGAPAVYPTTTTAGWTVVHHGTLGPPRDPLPLLPAAQRRAHAQSAAARLPISSPAAPWKPAAPAGAREKGRPLPVPPPPDAVPGPGAAGPSAGASARQAPREPHARPADAARPCRASALSPSSRPLPPIPPPPSTRAPTPSAPASASASSSAGASSSRAGSVSSSTRPGGSAKRSRTPDANPYPSPYAPRRPTAGSPTLPFDGVSGVWALRPATASHSAHPSASSSSASASSSSVQHAIARKRSAEPVRPVVRKTSSGNLSAGAGGVQRRPSLPRHTSAGGEYGAAAPSRRPSLVRHTSGEVWDDGPQTEPRAPPEWGECWCWWKWKWEWRLPRKSSMSSMSASASPALASSPLSSFSSASVPHLPRTTSSTSLSQSPNGNAHPHPHTFTPAHSPRTSNASNTPTPTHPHAANAPPPPVAGVRKGHTRSASGPVVITAAGSGGGGIVPQPPPPLRGMSYGTPTPEMPYTYPALAPPTPLLLPARPPSGMGKLSPSPASAHPSSAGSGSGSAGSTASPGSGPTAQNTSPSTGRSLSPPPPPPPPLSMSAVLLARGGGGGAGYPHNPSPSGQKDNASFGTGPGYMASPSAYTPSSSSSAPSSARSAQAGFAWRYSSEGTEESPMTAATTPAREGSAGGGWKEREPMWREREREWQDREGGGAVEVVVPGPLSPKRERRRLRLHSPMDVSPIEAIPDANEGVHSHPIGDESEADLDSAGGAGAGDGRAAWLAALEGEVRGEEIDGVALSPPVFATLAPGELSDEEFDDDDFALDANPYAPAGDTLGDDTFDTGAYSYTDADALRVVSRSPSPIRYARRRSVDGLELTDSGEESDASDAMPDDASGPSVLTDAKSTFSRARSVRSTRRRRNTRAAAPPPVPLASAAGTNRRARARSADSSILDFGEALAPSEMWRLEQAARTAAGGGGGGPKEMQYVYTARLPASVPPPFVAGPGSLASLSSGRDAPSSGHGHGSSDSGRQPGYYAPSANTSKSSLGVHGAPGSALSKKETLKLLKREKKERERQRARDREQEKTMRKSSSISLLRGVGPPSTHSPSNSSMEGMTRTSGGSDELLPNKRTRPALLSYLGR